MDWTIYSLFFLAGGLVSYILLARPTTYMGQFEKIIMAGLDEGRKVIVSMDSEAYIFQKFGNRIKVSLGTVEMLEELPHGNVVDVSGNTESVHSDSGVVDSMENK